VTLVSDLVTEALHDDFDRVKYGGRAAKFVADAVQLIFSTTSLARGDYVPTASVVNAGNPSFALGDSAIRITSVFHTDTGEELVEVPLDDLAAAQAVPNPPRGRPVYYALTGAGLTAEGTTVLLSPLPDKTYTLQVRGRYAPAITDLEVGDTVPLPARYDRMPVSYARAKLFALEDDAEMSNFWMSTFTGEVQTLRADLQRRSERVRRVAGTWSDLGSAPRFRHPQGLF
jgi:hypothetical protein